MATARFFERFCDSRLASSIPTCLHGLLSFPEHTMLVTAGLIVDPGGATPQIHRFGLTTTDSGNSIWRARFHNVALSFPNGSHIPGNIGDRRLAALVYEKGVPAIPTYVLTNEGLAISRILPNQEESALKRLVASIKAKSPTLDITLSKRSNDDWIALEQS